MDMSSFSAKHVLTRSLKETTGSFCLAPDLTSGSFVLDMGCVTDSDHVEVVNTHNTVFNDRSKSQFPQITLIG